MSFYLIYGKLCFGIFDSRGRLIRGIMSGNCCGDSSFISSSLSCFLNEVLRITGLEDMQKSSLQC